MSQDFSSSRCSVVHFGAFSSSREQGGWPSSVTGCAMASKGRGETWTTELDTGLSGDSGWESRSSEPGLRDIMIGSGGVEKGGKQKAVK